MLYQILTEDTGRQNITRILDADFQGYTLIPASGQWQGVPEPSVIAEIDTDNDAAVRRDAELIREANHQQAVLVEAIPSHSELITEHAALDHAVGEHDAEQALANLDADLAEDALKAKPDAKPAVVEFDVPDTWTLARDSHDRDGYITKPIPARYAKRVLPVVSDLPVAA